MAAATAPAVPQAGAQEGVRPVFPKATLPCTRNASVVGSGPLHGACVAPSLLCGEGVPAGTGPWQVLLCLRAGSAAL